MLVFVFAVAGFAVALNLFGRVVGLTSPWFALIVMLVFLGMVRFASPFYLLKLPRPLRRLRPRDISGKQSSGLRVAAFGQLLRRTPLRPLIPVVYMSQHPGEPDAVRRRVESAEAAHWCDAVLVTLYIVYACNQKWWRVVACFFVLQAAGNVYPILHLRLVRGRLQRFLDKQAARQATRSLPSISMRDKEKTGQ